MIIIYKWLWFAGSHVNEIKLNHIIITADTETKFFYKPKLKFLNLCERVY